MPWLGSAASAAGTAALGAGSTLASLPTAAGGAALQGLGSAATTLGMGGLGSALARYGGGVSGALGSAGQSALGGQIPGNISMVGPGNISAAEMALMRGPGGSALQTMGPGWNLQDLGQRLMREAPSGAPPATSPFPTAPRPLTPIPQRRQQNQQGSFYMNPQGFVARRPMVPLLPV